METYLYNPVNQFGKAFLTVDDVPVASPSASGTVTMAPEATTSVVYDKTQVDVLIETATGGGITSVVKSPDSTSGLTITKTGSEVTIDLKDASTTQKGIVALSSAIDSDSVDLAATSLAVKTLNDSKASSVTKNGTKIEAVDGNINLGEVLTNVSLLVADDTGTPYNIFTVGNGVRQGSLTFAPEVFDLRVDTGSADIGIKSASTTVPGIVQLSTATNSASTSTAATSSAVKAAYDLASSKMDALEINLNGSDITPVTKLVITTNDNTITIDDTVGILNFAINPANVKTALGLGTAAYVNTGTASGNVPLLGTGGKLAMAQLPTAITYSNSGEGFSNNVALGQSGITLSSNNKESGNVEQTNIDITGAGITYNYTHSNGAESTFSVTSTGTEISDLKIYNAPTEANDAVRLGDLSAYAKTADLGTAAFANTGTASGNVPVLDADGKLAESTLPSIALVDIIEVPTADTIAEILTRVNSTTETPEAKQGDIVITLAGDLSGHVYMVKTTKTPGTYVESDLLPIKIPAGSVSSVSINGSTFTPTNGLVNLGQNYVTSITGAGSAITATASGTANNIVTLDIRGATTTQTGAVQLNDTLTSTSVTQAATANAVKKVTDLANLKLNYMSIAGTTGTWVLDPSTDPSATQAYLNFASADNLITYTVSNHGGVGDVQITSAIDTNQLQVTLGLDSKIDSLTSNNTAGTNIALSVSGTKNTRNIVAPVNNTFATSTLVTTAISQALVSDYQVTEFVKTRVYNNEIKFTSADVTGTTAGAKGTYEYTWTPPTGSTRAAAPRVLQVILSNNSTAFVPVTYDDTTKKLTITFFDASDDVTLVYGGIFNTAGNQHTMVLSQVVAQ